MLNWLKNRLTTTNKRANAPHIIPSRQHPISPRDISKAARDTVQQLTDAGYQAYAVGGCVRDLLLKNHPKDFDVATNATPEQVKNLFRRSRIVGRRFQIVHVRLGREMIEVTTFRAHHQQQSSSQSSSQDSRQSKQGMLLRDNIFGDINQDAARRDFTINALYYNPLDNTIYDYADGLTDLQQRTIRMIGDPEQRYREDPVRMLRAVRFSARLGFDIEPQTVKPIQQLAKLLRDIPPARLFDEVVKLLMSGHGLATFHLLRQQQLFGELFPATDALLDSDDRLSHFVEQALINTDQRIRSGKRVTPAFLYAALLWPVVEKHSQQFLQKGESPSFAWQHGGNLAIEQQLSRIAIPRRFTTPTREIWSLQQRLSRRNGKQAERLMEHPRFRAGYDFVLLREQAGENLDGLGHWWTVYQESDEQKRLEMVSKPGNNRKPRRRKSGNRKPGNSKPS